MIKRNTRLKSVDTYDLPTPPFHQQHAMLLHSGDEDNTATKYVNEALKKGYLIVDLLGNVHNNALNLSKIASLANIDHEDNANRDNLLTLDVKSFYKFALVRDLSPFEELKVLLEEAIKERITSKRNDEMILIAGIAGDLAKNQRFDESINVEKWWQKTYSEWLQKGLKVTIICPHSSPILGESQFMHYKQAISWLHNITLEPISRRRSST